MYRKNHCNTRHMSARLERGFSLIELMIAMTVGLIVLAGLTRIFVGSKNAYTVQDEMGKLQENGRFAEEFIAFDVRMAGFQGCGNLFRMRPNIIANPAPIRPLTAGNAVFGYEWVAGNYNPLLPAALSGRLSAVPAGTDVVTIQRGSECGATLTANMAADNVDIQVAGPNSCGFAPNQYLMITDCRTADIFLASNVTGAGPQTIAHGNTVNSSDRLTKAYQQDAQVYRFTSATYYIAPGADGRPALWRFTEGRNPATTDLNEELVAGVEDLQVLYGEDLNNNQAAERYLSANAPVAMGRVTSVRLALLMQSTSTNVALDRQQYTYNDQTFNAADGRLRRTFTAVVNLRNRTLNTPN